MHGFSFLGFSLCFDVLSFSYAVASAPPPAPMQAGSPMGGGIGAAVADGQCLVA